MKIRIFSDGGSRGNPGHSGFGVVAKNTDGQVIWEESKYLGIKTNNEAEYAGLISGLDWLRNNEKKLNITEVEFCADSELMVKQMQLIYKVRADNLIGLNKSARELISKIDARVVFKAILRELNSEADQLANRAMDEKK